MHGTKMKTLGPSETTKNEGITILEQYLCNHATLVTLMYTKETVKLQRYTI